MDKCAKALDLDKKRWKYLLNSRNACRSVEGMLTKETYNTNYTRNIPKKVGADGRKEQRIRSIIDIQVPKHVLGVKSLKLKAPELLDGEKVRISLRIRTQSDILDQVNFFDG